LPSDYYLRRDCHQIIASEEIAIMPLDHWDIGTGQKVNVQ